MKFKSPILETDRLILKPGNYQDFVKVYEYDMTKLRDVAGEFEFVKQDPKNLTGYDTYALEHDNVYDWIIYLKNNKEPIGNIFLEHHNEEENSNELGFNLHPNYWGQEYMKEAIICVLDFLFSKGYDKIYCGYDDGNIKSKRLQEKVGFVYFKSFPNNWIKNDISITVYKNVMTSDNYNKLYGSKKINKKTRN